MFSKRLCRLLDTAERRFVRPHRFKQLFPVVPGPAINDILYFQSQHENKHYLVGIQCFDVAAYFASSQYSTFIDLVRSFAFLQEN